MHVDAVLPAPPSTPQMMTLVLDLSQVLEACVIPHEDGIQQHEPPTLPYLSAVSSVPDPSHRPSRVGRSNIMDRLKQVVAHIAPFGSSKSGPTKHHSHELNPTYFLPKAARINPDQLAILHYTSQNVRLERSYSEFAARSMNLAYYLRDQISASGKNIVALLASNTPMMLEAYYAIAAAGGIFAAVNYRLQKHEIQYIINHSGAGTIIVDREYYPMVSDMNLRIIIDDDIDGKSGQYEECIRAGALRDTGAGWEGLTYEHVDEDETIGICYTSGTTGNPKGVEFSHRGVYLGAVANLIDSGLNCADVFGYGACKYLWTLPMFHAAGWIFPWAGNNADRNCMHRVTNPDSYPGYGNSCLSQENGLHTDLAAADAGGTRLEFENDACKTDLRSQSHISVEHPLSVL